MRFLSLTILSCLTLCFFACGSQTSSTATAEAPAVLTDAPVMVDNTFGSEFSPDKVIAANQLLATYDEATIEDTITTTIQGTVDAVCQAKGCWMTIAAGDEKEMMVKFKDYGFFMPKDISGREVIMNGIAFYEVTPVDELRHYAEDAGDSPEEIAKITEPKRELKFLADGVQLLK
jgi:hypothetical protein